ncbi:flavoprotein [Ralstonia solanacearum]|uniref:flavoprotein n=1 Tax=Ralstonia solanacearum TaxID=305 RepID=UPI0018D01202|nr:flavoprotein [Ralstonia solanacearum]MDB0566474.1 flavoprotein [Ralstonia solanacearum]MDB0575843.1 flavoprotein [Ralstonia solanacearum]
MLSETAQSRIDAGVPVLHGRGLTTMPTSHRQRFASYPEPTGFFDMGDQANGAQPSPVSAMRLEGAPAASASRAALPGRMTADACIDANADNTATAEVSAHP